MRHVKYKNLKNDRITEEKDLFVSHLCEKFPDVRDDFVYSIVDCIEDAIQEEGLCGMVGGKYDDAKAKTDTQNFLKEIEKFSKDPTRKYIPRINMTIPDSSALASLLSLMGLDGDSFSGFLEDHLTELPVNVKPERIREVTLFAFNAIKETTERSYAGEKVQSRVDRAAEDERRKREEERVRKREEAAEPSLQERRGNADDPKVLELEEEVLGVGSKIGSAIARTYRWRPRERWAPHLQESSSSTMLGVPAPEVEPKEEVESKSQNALLDAFFDYSEEPSSPGFSERSEELMSPHSSRLSRKKELERKLLEQSELRLDHTIEQKKHKKNYEEEEKGSMHKGSDVYPLLLGKKLPKYHLFGQKQENLSSLDTEKERLFKSVVESLKEGLHKRRGRGRRRPKDNQKQTLVPPHTLPRTTEQKEYKESCDEKKEKGHGHWQQIYLQESTPNPEVLKAKRQHRERWLEPEETWPQR